VNLQREGPRDRARDALARLPPVDPRVADGAELLAGIGADHVGAPDAQGDALTWWREAPELFDAVERAGLTLTEELTQHIETSVEAVATVRELLGEQATLELVVLAGLCGMVSHQLRSLAVDPEPGDTATPCDPARRVRSTEEAL
jgi:hypothetical protein